MQEQEELQESHKGLISITSATSALNIGSFSNDCIKVEKLSGGLTNENVVVTLHDAAENKKERRIVFRRFLAKTSHHLNYNRQEEYINSNIAHMKKGVGAPVVGYIPPTEQHGGALALEFVDGQTMDERAIQTMCASQSNRSKIIAAIKKLHNGPALFINIFDPFEARVRYEEEVRRLSGSGVPWPGYNEAVQQLEIVKVHLSKTGEERVDCHNDLLSANFLDSRPDLIIIDWELSGQAEPSWDIGNFLSENGLDNDESVITCFVSEYWQSTSSEYIKTKVNRAKLYSLVSKITWAAWGAVLHFLDRQDDFDYKAWSIDKLQKAQSLLCDQDKMTDLLQE